MAKRVALLLLGFLSFAGCEADSASTKKVAVAPIRQPIPPAPAPRQVQIQPMPYVVPSPVAPAPALRAGSAPAGWIPSANAPHREWDYIVIHHSATPSGGAAKFDREHKAKGWDELGYHFVIGNGTETRDGQVEVGPRWPKQKWGAHAKTPDNQFNEHGVGICLVGNFDVTRPTAAQTQALTKLVAFLMQRYDIPASRILGHGMTKATDCPGRNLNVALVRQMATRAVAEAGGIVTPDPVTVAGGTELMRPIGR